MKVYFIERRAAFGPAEGLSFLDDMMFHGVVCRNIPLHDNNLGDDLSGRLALIRNGYIRARVTKPFRNLVVTDDIVGLLEGSKNVMFHEVVIAKHFWSKYEFGKRWYGAPNDFEGIEEFYRDQPAVVVRTEPWPRYFEVVTASLDKIRGGFALLREYEVSNTLIAGVVRMLLQPEMFEEYPVLWTTNGIAMTEGVYEMLRAHIDLRFFNRAELVM